jgi:DNA-directed RNA polymerase specialized sigma24 family protein
VIEGKLLRLNLSSRPQPAGLAAVSATAATASETSSDDVLVEHIAVGSKLAMRALFARHRTYVYHWLLRFVSDATLAEDLLSEVFLDVWCQGARFQHRSYVPTWLMAIARQRGRSSKRAPIRVARLRCAVTSSPKATSRPARNPTSHRIRRMTKHSTPRSTSSAASRRIRPTRRTRQSRTRVGVIADGTRGTRVTQMKCRRLPANQNYRDGQG